MPLAGNEPAGALVHHHAVAGRLGRYNAVAILPQGAFDVQSIRTSQTTDPWAKQTRPIWPCTKFG